MRIWPGGREHHVARRDTSRVPKDNLRCLTARLMYFSTSYTSTSLTWGKQYRLPFFTKAYIMRNSLLAAAPTVSLGSKGCRCNSLSRLIRDHSLKSGLQRSRAIAAIHRHERSLGLPFLLICVMRCRLPADSQEVGLVPASFMSCPAFRYACKGPVSASIPAAETCPTPCIDSMQRDERGRHGHPATHLQPEPGL